MAQIFLIELIKPNSEETEIYASNAGVLKEPYGVEFKGQLLKTTQLKKIDKELSFEIEPEKQTSKFVPWHRVKEIRNLSFEKKVKEAKGV